MEHAVLIRQTCQPIFSENRIDWTLWVVDTENQTYRAVFMVDTEEWKDTLSAVKKVPSEDT